MPLARPAQGGRRCDAHVCGSWLAGSRILVPLHTSFLLNCVLLPLPLTLPTLNHVSAAFGATTQTDRLRLRRFVREYRSALAPAPPPGLDDGSQVGLHWLAVDGARRGLGANDQR